MPDPNENEVIVRQEGRDEQGRPVASTRLTPDADARECVVLCESDNVIPIVFLPGIMGTNLRGASGGGSVWRPPNLDGVMPVLGAIGTMIGFFFRGPATRQRRLDPRSTEIDDRGPTDAEGAISKQEARARRWGTLMRSAYHPVMSLMQRQLNALMENCELLGEWRDGMLYRRAPADYGEQNGVDALTEAEIKHAAQYRFEVWGGGYNWLQSNGDSGKEMQAYIKDVVLQYYRDELGDAAADQMKVILVTHSMGGFVARALTSTAAESDLAAGKAVGLGAGSDNILGAVLGVMPATGAPATYKRMRSGFESVAKIILGRNAAEVTAVMGNAPGALELLPTADYGEGGQERDCAWLKLGGPSGSNAWTYALPCEGDPYEEIYKSRSWYGLVPAHNEKLLDPAGSSDSGKEEDGNAWSIWDVFDRRIDAVEKFHRTINKHYPAPAYAHYGDDSVQVAWSEVHWNGATLPVDGDVNRFRAQSDNGKARLHLNVDGATVTLDIADENGHGDETVPALSGMAPGQAEVVGNFRQGDQGLGEHVDTNRKGRLEGYEHQDSYNDPRAQWATLYGIVKIAQEAKWACES